MLNYFSNAPLAQEKKEKAEQTALIGEAVEKMPPEVRRIFQGFAASFSSQISGPRPNPLFEKFTPEHIDKYLDYIQRDDDHDYELKKTNRMYYMVYALVALAAFGAGVVYLLPRDKDLLIQLITLIVILGGGVGAGYGLSKRRQK
jgi:hypothetical protein